MFIQMKNKNEYIEDGNLHIKKIKFCSCRMKAGDKYIITCNIHQRGTYSYQFRKADKWITKIYSKRKLWLSADAESAVCEAVDLFDDQIKRIETSKNRQIKMEDAGLLVVFGKTGCLIKYFNDNTKQTVKELYAKTSIEEILHRLQFMQGLINGESKELLSNPSKENIMKHPFIIAARKEGDIMTEKRVKVFYRLADEDDCKLLAEMSGMNILPALSKEYDREYYIEADTLTNKYYDLLYRSGYKLLHRPYFGMKGNTHSKITLNPHTKIGVDAARTDAKSISFDDFLSMFENL